MTACLVPLLIALATSASAAPAVGAAGENPLLDPLGEDWQIGYQQKTSNAAIVEFVHAGETVKDWKELATLLSLDGGKGMDMDDYVERVRAKMNTSCPRDPRVRVLSKKPVSGLPARLLAVECRAYASGKPESFVELAVAGRQAMYTLQLARKVERLDAKLLPRFTTFVKKLKICDDADASRPCAAAR